LKHHLNVFPVGRKGSLQKNPSSVINFPDVKGSGVEVCCSSDDEGASLKSICCVKAGFGNKLYSKLKKQKKTMQENL